MRERLKQHMERLFENAPRTRSAQELKEEMLQNLYDKYDDLIAEGKSEEDAYAIAIAGIGDVAGLIAGTREQGNAVPAATPIVKPAPKQKNPAVLAVAIVLYVLSVVPNIAFGGVTGVIMMFAMIAIATAMLIMNRTVVHPTRAALVGAGVALCILCPAPAIAFGGVFGTALLFVLLAAGVGLIVYGRTSRFDEAPADDEAATGGAARATHYTYIGLIAVCALLVLGAILSDGRSRRQVEWQGPIGEIMTDESVFEARIEDRIEEKLDGAFDETEPDDDDDDDDKDKNKKPSGKQAAAATAAIMDGAAEVAANGITDIEIDWVGGAVHVAPYGGDTIAISETAAKALTEGQKLRYYVKGNKLTISYCEETFHIWDWLDIDKLRMPAKTLTVQLPQGMLTELEINGVSAEIDVRGVAFDELEVESVSGDVTVTDVSGRKLTIQTTSGKGSVTGADVTKLNVESVSGKMRVAETRADDVDVESTSAEIMLALRNAPLKIEAESVSGNVTLTLPKDATDFTVRMESVSGDFDCNIALVTQNGRYVAGSGAAQYEFSSVSGDFTITAG